MEAKSQFDEKRQHFIIKELGIRDVEPDTEHNFIIGE